MSQDNEKITVARIWQIMLERAAADAGTTLDDIKQQLADGRALLSIRFHTVAPKDESPCQ